MRRSEDRRLRRLLAASIWLTGVTAAALIVSAEWVTPDIAWTREQAQRCSFDVSNLPALTAREDRRMGAANAGNGDAELTSAYRLTVARNGNVVVTDRQRLVLFDSTGRILRSVGRQGQGPGEFQALEFVGSVRDTIWAYDRRTQRLSFFGQNGDLIRTAPLPALSRPAGEYPRFIAVLDGLLRMDTVYTPRDTTRPVEIVVQPLDGGPSRTVSTEQFMRPAFGPVMGGRSGSEIHKPWFDGRLVQPSPDGRAVVTIDRRIATSDDTGSITLRWLSPTGVPRLDCRYRYRPARITDRGADSIASYLARSYGTQLLAISAGSAEEAAFAKAIKAQLIIPRYAPWLSGAVIGNDGSVLIARDFQLGRYVLIASDGRPRGTLSIAVNPDRNGDGIIYAISRDAIWVRRLDENDVPSIVRYRISGGD
jgi:hypothetical protein